MPALDKHKVYGELQRFNQRKLTRGEIVLLAQCLSNSIPCVPDGVENPKMHVLGFSGLIERVVYSINNYAYIDTETLEFLKDTVTRFVLWKTDVARGKLRLCFTGDTGVVIDELSGLTRYFDSGVLCSIGDVLMTANWLLGAFKDLIAYEESCLVTDKGDANVVN